MIDLIGNHVGATVREVLVVDAVHRPHFGFRTLSPEHVPGRQAHEQGPDGDSDKLPLHACGWRITTQPAIR